MISFLPLAHMLERTCEQSVYYAGGAVGFYSGNIKDLTHDLKALRPTIMPAVPRLFNRVYDKYQTDVAGSSIRRMVFNMAMKAKEADIKRQVLRRNTIWDRFAFRNVQECKFILIMQFNCFFLFFFFLILFANLNGKYLK